MSETMMMIKRCDDDTNNDDNAASDPHEIEMLERSIRTQRETKAHRLCVELTVGWWQTGPREETTHGAKSGCRGWR